MSRLELMPLRVRRIAEDAVDDALDQAGRRDNPVATLSPADRELRGRLIDRASAAIEQAIEHELEAIRAELTA